MAFVREWTRTTALSVNPATFSGTATIEGNTLFLDVFIREDDPKPQNVTITDSSGTNTWSLVGSATPAGLAHNYYLYICTNAASITSVTLEYEDSLGASFAVDSIALLQEFSDVGALVNAQVTYVDNATHPRMPTAYAAEAGQLVKATNVCAATVRSWTATGSGVTPTQSSTFAQSQIELDRAYAYVETAGSVAIGWTEAAADPIPSVIVQAIYDAPSPAPEPQFLVAATGLTAVGAGTLLAAVSDADTDTYGETDEGLVGTFIGTMPELEVPTADFTADVTVSVSVGTASVRASISPDGTTWVNANAPATATTAATEETFTWPLASISGYDLTDWEAMQIRVTFAGDE